jgi:hypothetical protein
MSKDAWGSLALGLALAGAFASLVVLLRTQTGRSAAAFGASAAALYFTL